MIGIIGAMDEEVKALADMMSGVETATVAGMVFKKGQLKKTILKLLRTNLLRVCCTIM